MIDNCYRKKNQLYLNETRLPEAKYKSMTLSLFANIIRNFKLLAYRIT